MIKKKNLVCLFTGILTIFNGYCQNTQTYEGLLAVNDVNYQAEYDYYVANEDTVFHGPYAITNFREENPESNVYDYSAVKGSFHENIPHGEWTIRKGKFSPTGEPEFEDYTYGYNINGTEFLAKGNFNKGIKNTAWTILEWEIINSTPRDTILAAHLPYRDNSIEGDFHFTYNNQILEGSINSEQFTDEKWSFYLRDSLGNKQLLKEWVFENNQMLQKVLYENDEVITIDINSSVTRETVMEEIPLTGSYLEIIDLKALAADDTKYRKYEEQRRVRDLFFMVMDNLKQIDSTLSPVANVLLTPHLKTRIAKYPYDRGEEASLQEISQNAQRANDLLETIKNDPQINLGSFSIPEVAFLTSTVREIQVGFVENLNLISRNYRNGNLEYVNRNDLTRNILNVSTMIEVPTLFDGDTIPRSYQMKHLEVDPGKDPLEQLETVSKNVVTELNSLNDSLMVYVEEIKKEKNLSQIEGDLIKAHQQVKSLSDSLLDARHQVQAGFDVKSVIDDFSDSLLKEYSNLNSTREKSERIAGFLQCFDRIEALIYTLEASPENAELVKEAYTNHVFNPYTYTDMKEIVKEPIYNSFNNILLPGIYKNLQKLECDNIEAYTRNFEIIFEDVIKILDKNTRRAENRVKRTSNPSRIAEILNLDLKF